MTNKDDYKVLNNVDTGFVGTLYCPGCGKKVIDHLGVDRIQSFEHECPDCGAPLFEVNTLLIPESSDVEEPDLEYAKKLMKEYWKKERMKLDVWCGDFGWEK